MAERRDAQHTEHDDQRPGSGDTSERSEGPRVEYRGAGIIGGVIIGALLVIATLVVLVQNTDDVPFEFLWFDVDLPLGVLLLVAGLIALASGELIGLLWRRRRRRVRTMRRELDELRRRESAGRAGAGS